MKWRKFAGGFAVLTIVACNSSTGAHSTKETAGMPEPRGDMSGYVSYTMHFTTGLKISDLEIFASPLVDFHLLRTEEEVSFFASGATDETMGVRLASETYAYYSRDAKSTEITNRANGVEEVESQALLSISLSDFVVLRSDVPEWLADEDRLNNQTRSWQLTVSDPRVTDCQIVVGDFEGPSCWSIQSSDPAFSASTFRVAAHKLDPDAFLQIEYGVDDVFEDDGSLVKAIWEVTENNED